MESKRSEALTIIDAYSRSDGRHVVRIDVQSKDFLHELASIFAKLAHGGVEDFQLLQSENLVLSSHIRSFILKRTSVRPGSTIRTISDDSKIQVIWEGPTDSWLANGQLLQGLIDSDAPCHQYFTDTHTDAELEIAFGERRPSAYSVL
jgi:hypothetical protein